ncbi:MAG TPA: hypothetical protein VFE18_15060 [Phenylobacterium sp.]|jgi:hypothetical protein|uniref:hypothetical protein n=1 Tax=Phenylobacterium sp. TaxID=1871053 RepID=UPI002D63D9E1|nr:hypothetical protein [Phenylobacterium sp.]HZZ69490.1 hypothetical protein [Phenylobacterium sp.]
MNAIRKTIEKMSDSLRRPFRAAENAEDRSDREAVEHARRDLKAGRLETIPHEELKARLGD